MGKAASLRSRVRSYFQESRGRDPKTDALVAPDPRPRLHRHRQRARGAHPRVEPGQEASAPLQHHPSRRQALPVPQAHHRRGVPAAGGGPARARRTAPRTSVRSTRPRPCARPCASCASSSRCAPAASRSTADSSARASSTSSTAATRRARGGRRARATRRRCGRSSASSRARTTTSPCSSRGRWSRRRTRPSSSGPLRCATGSRPSTPSASGRRSSRPSRRTRTSSASPARAATPACSCSSCARAGCSAASRSSSTAWPAARRRGARRPSSASSTRARSRPLPSCSCPRTSPDASLTAEWLRQRARAAGWRCRSPARTEGASWSPWPRRTPPLALQNHLLARESRHQAASRTCSGARPARAAAPDRGLRHLDHPGQRDGRPRWWCGWTAR